MSVRPSGSLASGRNPESSYRDSTADRDSSTSDRNNLTPSPEVEDSHEEYTPTHNSIRRAASSIWTTPSHRSNSGNISSHARRALDELYARVYGEDSRRCLLTQLEGTTLIVAHVVQRASKSDWLTLYEYCLGFDWQTFHVDSRRNLFYLTSDWHIKFDARQWLLLPDTAALDDVRDFVKAVTAARKDPALSQIPAFQSKWGLRIKTKYTLIPLPGLERPPLFRRILNPSESWQHHPYPYQSLPMLECHVAPPFAVINAGLKCVGADLDAIALDCYQQQTDESQQALKHQLTLLCETWALFDNAKDDAEAWEVAKRGKRRRDHDDDDIERLSQMSKRTTRSQSQLQSTLGSPRARSAPSSSSGQSRQSGTKNKPKQTSGTRKRKEAPSSSGTTLTKDAVSRLGKRRKVVDLNVIVRRWVESACG